ncbi:bis(5'-nucleosyl)-tetraphosphatase (symmetrical) YqeK [Enterococcus gilvus]|uniref:bis(5'-nucleosyl)-tetraphosphatase (symmetrical) YqeK n=1 Tax=Enterococcus gilvus TaxID=160453 RepID=UPI001C8C3933|nr:bis(5'-nucleosyl)-tetraphosphatase (symmetrical) YqeK [Enterococcus gilvus]MBX8936501.1 HD domain-containing protein [Enterococcus gilvus]
MRERAFLAPVTENFLHAIGVGKVSYELALKYGIDPKTAFIAGSLHDLGGAIPDSDRVQVADYYKIPLFLEEVKVPMLVHAKQGEFFARNLFDIHNSEILDSILFHTTCIDEASTLTKIVFIADKIHWDRNGEPPYLKGLLSALEVSLDEGCRYFLKWLWNSDLYVVHPFLKRSYGYYIENNTFPKLNKNSLTNEKQVEVKKDIREKYFLNEIKDEFDKIFALSNSAYKLAKNQDISPDAAFIAAALTTASDTISGNQKYIVAKALGLDPEEKNLLSKINHYFAKMEFKVKEPEILEAILNYKKEHIKENQKLARIVARAYQTFS